MGEGCTFYFIRHGQTYFNHYRKMQGWSNTPLTPKGREDFYDQGTVTVQPSMRLKLLTTIPSQIILRLFQLSTPLLIPIILVLTQRSLWAISALNLSSKTHAH